MIALTIIVVILGVAGFLYYNYHKAQQQLQPNNSNQTESEQLLTKLSKLIDLPQEEPTIATIKDITKLQSQPIFQKGKNGDKVIIFPKAQELIIYDPTENKIISVSKIDESSGSATLSQAKVAIKNGTSVAGLASKIEEVIKGPNIEIVSKGNASKSSYDKTLVIPLVNGAKDIASNLAKTLSASVSALPKGESAPAGADILIIIGSDHK